MGVGGSNLTGAFKLIFKIAKNDSNDALFVDTDLPELMVDALGRISPLNGSSSFMIIIFHFNKPLFLHIFQMASRRVQFTATEQYGFSQ